MCNARKSIIPVGTQPKYRDINKEQTVNFRVRNGLTKKFILFSRNKQNKWLLMHSYVFNISRTCYLQWFVYPKRTGREITKIFLKIDLTQIYPEVKKLQFLKKTTDLCMAVSDLFVKMLIQYDNQLMLKT